MKTPNEKAAERLLQEAWEAMDRAADAATPQEARRYRVEAARLQREAREHEKAAIAERAKCA